MFEITVLNMDKEKITIQASPDQLLPCLSALEQDRTYHNADGSVGFYFPKSNIRCVSYAKKDTSQPPVETPSKIEVLNSNEPV